MLRSERIGDEAGHTRGAGSGHAGKFGNGARLEQFLVKPLAGIFPPQIKQLPHWLFDRALVVGSWGLRKCIIPN